MYRKLFFLSFLSFLINISINPNLWASGIESKIALIEQRLDEILQDFIREDEDAPLIWENETYEINNDNNFYQIKNELRNIGVHYSFLWIDLHEKILNSAHLNEQNNLLDNFIEMISVDALNKKKKSLLKNYIGENGTLLIVEKLLIKGLKNLQELVDNDPDDQNSKKELETAIFEFNQFQKNYRELKDIYSHL